MNLATIINPSSTLSRLLLTTAMTGSALLLTQFAQAQGVKKPLNEQQSNEREVNAQNSDPGSISLGTIVVSGSGGTPPAYAGGQVAKGSRVGILGNKDVLDTPFSTVAYTEEFVQNREAQDLGSVISADPSVYVPNKRNIYETFSIRGFQSSADDVTFNGLVGMAPNMRGSTEFAERIELLKGPSTFLNGMPPGGSVAGSVNLAPKRADDIPLTRLTTTYASDSLFGVHADVGRRWGAEKEWGIRINGLFRDGDTAVEGESHRMALGSVALDYRGEKGRFSVDYYKQKEDMDGVNYFGLSNAAAVTILPPPRTGSHSLAPSWAFNTNDTDVVVLRGEYDLTDSVTAYAAYGWKWGGYDALISRSSLLNNAGDISVTGIRSARDGNQQSGEIGMRGDFMTGEVRHEWNISANRFKSDNTFKDLQIPIAGTTNYYNLSFGPAPDLTRYNAMGPTTSAEQTLSSVAISDTLSFFDERFQLTVGARYQKVETENYNLQTSTQTASYDSDRISPAVAAVFKTTDDFSIYANYIEGLSPGSTAPITADNAGDVLAPFQTKQVEVGAKWDLGDFTTTLALFQIKKPSAYLDPNTNIFGVYGEQRNRGVELNIFGEVQPGLRLLGGVSYTDAVMTKAAVAANEGKKATATPAVIARIGAEYDVGFVSGLTVTGNVNHTGKRYINADNSLALPSFTTLDLGARYVTEIASKPLTLRASVLNVTNKAYWAGGNLAGGYGAPRTFLLSASMDF
ncbi:TonB-dependent siderophore receptor [Brucella gallinifaecis]|uniref:TonB-dependent receptor n=1 Tax=Brucella gallinifaecis TaxID=215590 RepID=UPI00235E2615|nr:TonB-dependent siderophore receptor [Brucella gallinifaecis]